MQEYFTSCSPVSSSVAKCKMNALCWHSSWSHLQHLVSLCWPFPRNPENNVGQFDWEARGRATYMFFEFLSHRRSTWCLMKAHLYLCSLLLRCFAVIYGGAEWVASLHAMYLGPVRHMEESLNVSVSNLSEINGPWNRQFGWTTARQRCWSRASQVWTLSCCRYTKTPTRRSALFNVLDLPCWTALAKKTSCCELGLFVFCGNWPSLTIPNFTRDDS